MSSTKVYTSEVAINQHKRGMMAQGGPLFVKRTTSGSFVILITIDLIARDVSNLRLTVGLKGSIFYERWI